MKAIAIDFETASEERGSACSIGLAFIENGEVIRVEERLIRPKSMRFSPMNISIHGIRPEHVEHAPEFPEILDEFIDDFRGGLLLAHNAAFDMSVLRGACDTYRMSYPELGYLCTVKMSQKVWPHLISHKLNVLAEHMQLRFVHHNAKEDAIVCGLAAISMAREIGALSFADVPPKIGMRVGRLTKRGYEPCSIARF
ncbi:3'-5' exonuclease [Rhizobium sp. L1K21]|uniref:3'-5' exonuclease n=1 Tax=Rhizobium sp. L1K21 TaxID=2954933 RepID=UPI0020934658|nr:3'-5' exonuclease [Rhizobium sp. L1K21]MCO6185657.1 3'-5' exonuclease [Rhizobium sp. L1K21]